MSDLLPCPFCGGEATRLVGKYDFGGDWFETGCDNVGCPVLPSIKTLSQDHADESWNTRADRIEAIEPVTVQEAARVLLAEHQRCAQIPTQNRTPKEQRLATMGRNRLRALAERGE